MGKVRIGFVGVGGMGQMAHLRNYAAMDDCEVIALAELRPETGKLVAARYGIGKVYRDHKEMLANEKLDALVASQPFDHHIHLLGDLYKATKFLFTEKPIAVTVSSGETLAAAAKSAGCTHMVGYHKRSDPAVMYAKDTAAQWKASGEMGPLKYVRITMPSGDWIANGFIGLLNAGDKAPQQPVGEAGNDPWGNPAIAGMGAEEAKQYFSFVNYYIHQVNMMRHLLGEPYKVTYAEKSGVLLAVQSNSGVAGTIEMTPYRTTIEWEESMLMAFEKGYIKINLPAPVATNRCGTVEVYSDSGKTTPMRTIPTLPWVHAMRQQAINFCRVVKGEMKPPCEAAEAVEDLKIARDYIQMRNG